MYSASHNDHVKAVVQIPVVFQHTRLQLEHAITAVLISGAEWQEVMVRDVKQISHLLCETEEDMFDFLVRGKSMMKHMKDLGLPSIGNTFRDGDYDTVLQVLEDMEHHLKDADTTIATAKGKIRDCTKCAENVLESIQKKTLVLLKDSKEADKGWSTGGNVAAYGTAMIATVLTGVVGLPFIGVGLAVAGGTAAIGGGAVAVKHLSDIAHGEELKRHLQSNAHNLRGAYNDMSIDRDTLEQASMNIRKLLIAVDDAKTSVSGLYGQLNPEKAKPFYYRLKELARRCTELHALYETGIMDYTTKRIGRS